MKNATPSKSYFFAHCLCNSGEGEFKVNLILNKVCAILLLMAFGLSCQKPPSLELLPKPQSQNLDSHQQKKTGLCGLFFTVERLCAEFIWENIPDVSEKGSFVVKYFVQETPSKFADPRKTPAFKLVMPGGDLQQQVLKVEKISDGEFRVSNLVIDRVGYWEIHLQLKENNEVVDFVVKKIKI